MNLTLLDMKTFLFTFILFFVFVIGFSQELPKVEEAYNNGNYNEAIDLYEQELKNGVSSKLYYNLGNAYYKAQQIPSAILNYERALLLDPGNQDIRFNLEMTKRKLANRIEPVEIFFLVQWFRDLQNLQSSDAWAKLSIAFFILLIFCLFSFFFGRIRILKRIVFYGGLFLIVALIFTNIFSNNQKNKLSHKEYAILFEPSVTVKSSPNPGGKELFVIYEGVKIHIKRTLNDWCEIELEDGNVGWIPLSMVERI